MDISGCVRAKMSQTISNTDVITGNDVLHLLYIFVAFIHARLLHQLDFLLLCFVQCVQCSDD